MNATDLLGFSAGTLTTIAFIPQVVKTLRSGKADDISLLWLATFFAGMGMWLGYGLLLGSLPIIFANGVTLILLLPILVVKLRSPQPRVK